jgi:hypothetical protein
MYRPVFDAAVAAHGNLLAGGLNRAAAMRIAHDGLAAFEPSLEQAFALAAPPRRRAFSHPRPELRDIPRLHAPSAVRARRDHPHDQRNDHPHRPHPSASSPDGSRHACPLGRRRAFVRRGGRADHRCPRGRRGRRGPAHRGLEDLGHRPEGRAVLARPSCPASRPEASSEQCVPELDDACRCTGGLHPAAVPAFGTRIRWTLVLVKALSDVVGPEQARSLMRHWLNTRLHAS